MIFLDSSNFHFIDCTYTNDCKRYWTVLLAAFEGSKKCDKNEKAWGEDLRTEKTLRPEMNKKDWIKKCPCFRGVIGWDIEWMLH